MISIIAVNFKQKATVNVKQRQDIKPYLKHECDTISFSGKTSQAVAEELANIKKLFNVDFKPVKGKKGEFVSVKSCSQKVMDKIISTFDNERTKVGQDLLQYKTRDELVDFLPKLKAYHEKYGNGLKGLVVSPNERSYGSKKYELVVKKNIEGLKVYLDSDSEKRRNYFGVISHPMLRELKSIRDFLMWHPTNKDLGFEFKTIDGTYKLKLLSKSNGFNQHNGVGLIIENK